MTFQMPQSTEAALYRLKAYRPRAALERHTALAFLEDRFDIYQFLHLYQTFFPQQFAQSTASLYPQPSTEDPQQLAHSDRDIEFLQLLETQIPLAYWTTETAKEQRIHGIEVVDQGIDFHYYESWDLLKPAWRALFAFASTPRYWMDDVDPSLKECYEGEFGVAVDDIVPLKQIPKVAMRQRFKEAGRPLRFLPLCLKLLDKETGNLYLDATSCDCCEGYHTVLPWSEASIHTLMQAHRQAQRYLRYCQEFIDWLDSDIDTNLKTLLHRWNQPYD